MWVKKDIYSTHTVTDMQTHRQTDNGSGGIHESDLAERFNNYYVNVDSYLKEPIVNSEFERMNTFEQSKVPNDVEFKIPLINLWFVRIFFIKLEC